MVSSVWKCPVCGTIHDNQADALKCSQEGKPNVPEIGEQITISSDPIEISVEGAETEGAEYYGPPLIYSNSGEVVDISEVERDTEGRHVQVITVKTTAVEIPSSTTARRQDIHINVERKFNIYGSDSSPD